MPSEDASGQGTCCGGAAALQVGDCNVGWSVPTQVAACPAGDTLLFSPAKPSQLRINVHYEDNFCAPKVKVPPESIWVTYTFSAGNLKLNDKRPQTYADDSTDSGGNATITLPSFSGCGNITLRLYVSNKLVDIRTATVRTTDTNADGRTTSSDETSACNSNFNGTAGDTTDVRLVQNHRDHWRRNALHGTLVRRTNLCESPPTCIPRIGDSELFWSPNGNWVTFSERIAANRCKIFMVPSDPTYAPSAPPKQFTFAVGPPDTSDYDGSWSPLGNEIVFDRGDYRILRKGIPGVIADTAEHLVTASGSFIDRGDVTPAISPNGQWVAFSRKNVGGVGFSLWKVPILGGAATRLTSTEGLASADMYPRWSPDGIWITYQREHPGPYHTIRKVQASGSADQDVYSAGSGMNAANPAYSPDGLILTCAIGTPNTSIVNTRAHTLDHSLSVKRPIPNYPNHAIGAVFPDLFPRLSPDGTRLGLITNQVWTVRRNMNLPPRITAVGNLGVHDTTASVGFVVLVPSQPQPISLQVSDPESDPITCMAAFLEPWMTFTGCQLTVSPGPTEIGKTFYIALYATTPSGGTDAIVVSISVTEAHLSRRESDVSSDALPAALGGPDPVSGAFRFSTPAIPGASALLRIFDLTGRQVARIRGASGEPLVWDGTTPSGSRAASGVYYFRLDAASHRRTGRIVVAR